MSSAPTPYKELANVIESLALLVREARRARGLSLREAAGQIGFSFATLSRIENADDCVLSNAIAVLRWLDLTPVTYSKETPK